MKIWIKMEELRLRRMKCESDANTILKDLSMRQRVLKPFFTSMPKKIVSVFERTGHSLAGEEVELVLNSRKQEGQQDGMG